LTNGVFRLNQKGVDYDIKFLKQDPDTGTHVPFDISTATKVELEFFREDKTSFIKTATKHLVAGEWFVQYVNDEASPAVSILDQLGDWEVRPIATLPNEIYTPGSMVPFEVAK